MRKWMPLLAAMMMLLGLTLTVRTYAASEAAQMPPPVQVAQLEAALEGPMGAGIATDSAAASVSEAPGAPNEPHLGLLLAAGVLALWSLRRRLF